MRHEINSKGNTFSKLGPYIYFPNVFCDICGRLLASVLFKLLDSYLTFILFFRNWIYLLLWTTQIGTNQIWTIQIWTRQIWSIRNWTRQILLNGKF